MSDLQKGDTPDRDVTRLNRLQYEKSPYLRQHAANPVDWYPWGEEAFTENLRSIDNQATAYVCFNYQCRLPVTDPEKMLELIINS